MLDTISTQADHKRLHYQLDNLVEVERVQLEYLQHVWEPHRVYSVRVQHNLSAAREQGLLEYLLVDEHLKH